ncbi:hypothetical protein BJ741DRAFT_634286 [Chytriomyces cf. hyalinus JEL632]|nr:hypothetical protein BJ741DRAFT_634286 [Chytriomyces cf. hyalinus JEL632]
MANGCITVQPSNGKTCGRTTIVGTDYCMRWPSHSKKCGSTRTSTTAPCAAYATREFFPYCCSKHDMTRRVQTDTAVLRQDFLRDKVLEDVLRKTGHLDSYSKEPIKIVQVSEVDHVIELQTYRDVLDVLTPRHTENMTPFVRDSLANEISNLALTSQNTNKAKGQAIYACSEDRKFGDVNPAGLTHYLALEFNNHGGESRRKFTANITKEIVRSYDDQVALLHSGDKAHDVFIATLHEMFVDFKLFQ